MTTTAEVNLRDGPSTDSAAVVVLPADTRLQVTGEFQEAGPVRLVAGHRHRNRSIRLRHRAVSATRRRA